MELNREQIIKALECHANGCKCSQCPMPKRTKEHHLCWTELSKATLSLIKSQEQKIFSLENRLKECENGYEGTLFLDRCKLHDAEEKVKKLTEENEGWQKALVTQKEQADKAYYNLACEVEDLRAENERLREDNEIKSQKRANIFEIANAYERGKADTVRKMHHKIWLEFSDCTEEETVSVGSFRASVNQIAKEMLEDNPCT